MGIFENSYAISKMAKILHKVQPSCFVHIAQSALQNKNRAADGWNRRSPAKVHLKTKKQTNFSTFQIHPHSGIFRFAMRCTVLPRRHAGNFFEHTDQGTTVPVASLLGNLSY